MLVRNRTGKVSRTNRRSSPARSALPPRLCQGLSLVRTQKVRLFQGHAFMAKNAIGSRHVEEEIWHRDARRMGVGGQTEIWIEKDWQDRMFTIAETAHL